jgi:hypothetical protein
MKEIKEETKNEVEEDGVKYSDKRWEKKHTAKNGGNSK